MVCQEGVLEVVSGGRERAWASNRLPKTSRENEQRCLAIPSEKHVHLLVARKAWPRKRQRQLASIHHLILRLQ